MAAVSLCVFDLLIVRFMYATQADFFDSKGQSISFLVTVS